MRTLARRTIPTLLLVAVLALSATAAAAEPEAVAPPFAAGGEAAAAGVGAAAVESGCHSRNAIRFREADTTLLRHEVRHLGRIECADRTPLKRTTCFSALFKGEVGSPLEQLARDTGEGNDRCRAGSPYEGRHETGDRFVEEYGYNLTLRRGYRWQAGDGSYCHRTNDQRTLVCRDEHSTRAPKDEVEPHTSSD